MSERIYTERKILTGVLIGGSLAGSYYFWRTFHALGKPGHAIVVAIAFLVILLLAVASIFIPVLDRVPNTAFWALQVGLALGVTRGFLSTEIADHIEADKNVYSWRNTILIGVISMIITLGALIALFYVGSQVLDGGTTRYYGKLRHEIVFDSANLSEVEVERIASALTSTGFFDEEVQKTVDVAKSDNRFIITVYCTEAARVPEAIEFHKSWRSDLQRYFEVNPIVIDMVVGTPADRIARLE